MGSARRRILDDEDEVEDEEDEETASYVNGNASTGPGPSGFGHTELANGLSGKRATKRRIYSSNDEDEVEVFHLLHLLITIMTSYLLFIKIY